MNNPRIVSIEWGQLEGRRPRSAGSNARLPAHGSVIHVPLTRLKTEDGASGFGICRTERKRASELVGKRLNEVFDSTYGVSDVWQEFEYPLWDLMGQQAGLPVYKLAAAMHGIHVQMPLRVPCYDTSLYFDDLHLASQQDAARLLAWEALEGYKRGHRAFKIKVGRGARHLPLEEGTQRDIAIVHAVQAAVGADIAIMLDANNGYNLNLTKSVLTETMDCNVFWMEEPFHEDSVLYRDLQTWLQEKHMTVLIGDGEGEADPRLLQWVQEGLVNVLQYDIIQHGFTRWLATGRLLDTYKAYSAPHHYGTHYCNYAACHLASTIQGLLYVEWDEAMTPGLDTKGYAIADGHVLVPDMPGFGLTLDNELFQHVVAESGFALHR